jgi:hypothetical protein
LDKLKLIKEDESEEEFWVLADEVFDEMPRDFENPHEWQRLWEAG